MIVEEKKDQENYHPIWGVPLFSNKPFINKLSEKARHGDSQVYTVKTMGGQTVIIKQLTHRGSHSGIQQATTEARHYKIFEGNPHIVKCLDFFHTHDRLASYLVLEYCDQGTLQDLVEKREAEGLGFSESEILEVAWQVSAALSDMHASGFVHLDLKPSNIGVTLQSWGFVYRVLDLGLMVDTTGLGKYKIVGTIPYIAPEFSLAVEDPKNEKADLFSLGCVLYLLAVGSSLYDHVVGKQEVKPHGEYCSALRSKLPGLLEKLGEGRVQGVTRRCLEIEASRRCGAREVCADTGREAPKYFRQSFVGEFGKVDVGRLAMVDGLNGLGPEAKEGVKNKLLGVLVAHMGAAVRLTRGVSRGKSGLGETRLEDGEEEEYYGEFDEGGERCGFGVVYCKKKKEVYFGGVERGKKEGMGCTIFLEGGEFAVQGGVMRLDYCIGEHSGGELEDWEAELRGLEGKRYRGGVRRGLAEGSGVFTEEREACHIQVSSWFSGGRACGDGKMRVRFSDGRRREYEGEFESGRFVRGKMVDEGGSVYLGEWSGDESGIGSIKFRVNKTYTGGWEKLMMESEGPALLEVEGVYRYVGQFQGGKKEGQGVLEEFASKFHYQGGFSMDEKHGTGTLRTPVGIYCGSFERGELHGKVKVEYERGAAKRVDARFEEGKMKEGRVEYRDGGVYEGGLEGEGLRKGEGRMVEAKGGWVYEGEWAGDVVEGRGRMETKERVMEGVWRAGKMEGLGKVSDKRTGWRFNGTVENGRVVQGRVVERGGVVYEGKLEGELYEAKEGRMEFANGDRYFGEFKRGKIQGEGIRYYEEEGYCYTGQFVDGVPHGKGILSSKGYKYEGDFETGRLQGACLLKFHEQYKLLTNVRTFEGTIKDGAYIGLCRMVFSDKSAFDGEIFHLTGSFKYPSTCERFPVPLFQFEYLTGNGVVILSDQTRIEGRFKQGKAEDKVRIEANDGSVFEGEMRQGKKHGLGRITFKSGWVLQCEFDNDKTAKGTLDRPEEKTRYVGELNEVFEREGKGVLHFTAHSEYIKYEGEFNNGVMNGEGKMWKKNGDFFKGTFKNSKQKGKGVYITAKGDVFTGEFVGMVLTGNGTWAEKKTLNFYEGKFDNFKFIEGKTSLKAVDPKNMRLDPNRKVTTYEGRFTNCKFNGSGTITYPDGSNFVGEIFKGKPNGKGIISFPNKSYYSGDWWNGSILPGGTYYYPPDSQYESFKGEIKNNLPQGRGELFLKNDDEYVGSVVKGVPSGSGELYRNGSLIYQGDFANGVPYSELEGD